MKRQGQSPYLPHPLVTGFESASRFSLACQHTKLEFICLNNLGPKTCLLGEWLLSTAVFSSLASFCKTDRVAEISHLFILLPYFFFLIIYLKNFKQPRFITQSQPHPHLCLWQILCCCISCSVMFNSLRPHGVQPARLLRQRNFPGKHTGVGCHFLLQGIFPTQVMNPCHLCLLHWQAGCLPSGPPRKPTFGKK